MKNGREEVEFVKLHGPLSSPIADFASERGQRQGVLSGLDVFILAIFVTVIGDIDGAGGC
jgi:hypothetical protein